MPRFTVVIEANDPDRWVPGSWPMDVDSSDSRIIHHCANKLCRTENVKKIKVIANSTGKEVPDEAIIDN